MGDIGTEKRVIELEPMPETVPIQEPAAPAPTVPSNPVTEPEKIPA